MSPPRPLRASSALRLGRWCTGTARIHGQGDGTQRAGRRRMIERTTHQALRAAALPASVSLLCACGGAPPVRKADAVNPTASAISRDAATSARTTDPDAVHAERLSVRFGDVKQLAGTLRDLFQ